MDYKDYVKFWNLVKFVDWGKEAKEKQGNFKLRLKKKLRTVYSETELVYYKNIARSLRMELKAEIERYSEVKYGNKYLFPNNTGVISVSDDGFWDLTAHIVGLGREAYEECLLNPENILKYPDFVENFEYIFQEISVYEK